jgi:hypothetical protein
LKDSKWPSLLFEHAGKVDATFDVGSVGAKGPRFLLAAASQTSAKRIGCRQRGPLRLDETTIIDG